MTSDPAVVLDFWFGTDPSIRRAEWFEKSAEFDAACAAFLPAVRAARAQDRTEWGETAKGALALILLLDQLPRNLFRGSAEAFAADGFARIAAHRAIASGFDTGMTPMERMFLYLPFEHSEAMTDQDLSVRLFDTLRDVLGGGTVDYAGRHRDVIRRFGRFPHRNAVLGRSNTPEEAEYLAQPGAGF